MRAPESTVRWAFGLPSSPSVPSPPQLRVKELKEILQSLGLPRSGNKQDLVNRILHFTEQGDPSEFAISRRGGPVPVRPRPWPPLSGARANCRQSPRVRRALPPTRSKARPPLPRSCARQRDESHRERRGYLV